MSLTSSHDTPPNAWGAVSPLTQLWETEFGDTPEVVIRCLGIAIGGAAFWIYNGSLLGPLWALLYFLLLFANFLLLRHVTDQSPHMIIANYVVFCLSLSTYLALPIYLMIAGDQIMIFSGAVALIAYVVFTLYRPAPPGILGYLDIVVGFVLAYVNAITFLPLATDRFAQFVMVLLCLVFAIYYSLSVLRMRASRATFHNASQRSLEAQKMEAIGRLSGGIAHDFNNILTVLQGNLELYHEVPEGPERDGLVDEARVAAQRATALVAQLLAFARRAPLEARAHNANAVLEDLSTLSRRALPASIRLNTRSADVDACVMADANGLHSALLNLVLNANDAMEGRGTITLAVDVVQGAAAEAGSKTASGARDAHLCFSVTDDGPGMPPDVAERATEPFFTTKPVGKGSGLGLSMAMGFAEQSGGAMRIRTGPDGTVVALHLPMCSGADQAFPQS